MCRISLVNFDAFLRGYFCSTNIEGKIMKAFLSHSSMDKEFVQEVADLLGRSNCVFDKYSFSGGVEFERSILKGLKNTSVFVFFATRNSIESLWCEYELQEAFYGKINQAINKTVVYIIGDGVSLERIPLWLKRALIKNESSPSVIARDIQHHLNKSADSYLKPLFLGRSKERELLEDIISPYDGREKPNTFSVFGLPGIGRRSLLVSCISELFSLSRIVEFEIEAGDDIKSLCIKIADKSEPYSCQQELIDIISEINDFSEDDAYLKALENTEKLVLGGELPVFVDTGGCLLDDGYLKPFMNKFIMMSKEFKNSYFVFVTSRRISRDNKFPIESIAIEQLSKKTISQLLVKLSERHEFKIEPNQISDLSDYIDGYPPSAHYAAKQASIYGVPALISDKRQLVQFSKKRFVSHIKDQNLSCGDESVLKVLSQFSPLPMGCLLALYGDSIDRNIAHDNIYKLIDCSLVRVVDGQNYRISDPIKGSVRDVLGSPTIKELEIIIDPLVQCIEIVTDTFKLDFSRVLTRLTFYISDERLEKTGIKLRSDYIKLLEDAYHQQRYKEAIELGNEAVSACPDEPSARTYLIKALIQEEVWDEAIHQIDNLYPTDSLRNVYYLRGFLERKRGEPDKAIECYKDAQKHGRGGISIHRELAHCYLLKDDVESARRHVQKASKPQFENSHIMDMAAKLEIKAGNEANAQQYINKLQLIDKPKHYHMRASSFHLKFKRPEEALDHAQKSTEMGGKWFFSGRVQLIKSLIANSQHENARSEISSLDIDFKNQKHDVKNALKCSLAVAEGDNLVGLRLTDQFSSASSKQAKSFKKKFYLALSKDRSIPYDNRRLYTEKLKGLADVEDWDLFNDI